MIKYIVDECDYNYLEARQKVKPSLKKNELELVDHAFQTKSSAVIRMKNLSNPVSF